MIQAIILAGGAGTRLRPLTLNTPKPMVRVNGKPFLQYVIEGLKESGITDIILCVGYLSANFEEFFKDGRKFGVRIRYSIEREFLGTAGALKLAEAQLADDFIVLNGDTYLPVDHQMVWDKFKQSGKTGLMVAYDNSPKIAAGNIAVDSEGRVANYSKQEALKKGDQLISSGGCDRVPCEYIDAGIYVFRKKVLELIKKGVFVSLEKDVFPELIREKELQALVVKQRFYDMGTPERLALLGSILQ